MSELRPLRLLNAVENGTVLGAELNTYLSDAGRLAEFTVLFSQRGQAKRIANGQTTMTAIVNSIIATNAAFLQATSTNDTIVAAIVESALAMSTVSDSASVLQIVSDNTTSWSYFSGSIYYESHIKKIISHLSGVDPSLYGSTSLLILDPVSMGDISVSERGMRALVNSLPTVTIMAGDSVAMALVAADTTAITLVAQNTSIMPTIANNVEAMDEIVSRSVATALMASNAGAIQSIANNSTAWANYLTAPTFSANLKNIIANIVGLNASDYADVTAIFANETASLAVAGNQAAMQAVLSDSASIATLIASDNLDTVLGSSVAMTEIAGSESTMNTLMSNSVAFPIVLTSALAKAAIFASPTLLSTMLTPSSDSLATVQALAQTKVGPTPDTSIGSFQSLGLSGNVIILTAVMGSIVGTLLDNYFKGDTGPTDTFGCPGVQAAVPPTAVNKGYTNVVWDVNSIAATAAAKVTVTYVDFN